jgi:serine/threonine-protein kinase
VWGTPAYLAPERIDGGEVTPASDVYALGLLLYRLLAGAPPWRAESIADLFDAHRFLAPAPLPELAGVPATVRGICLACLAKDPRSRPEAGEVAGVLAAAAGRPGRSAVPVGSVPVGAPLVGTAAVGTASVAGPAGVGAAGVAGGAPAVDPAVAGPARVVGRAGVSRAGVSRAVVGTAVAGTASSVSARASTPADPRTAVRAVPVPSGSRPRRTRRRRALAGMATALAATLALGLSATHPTADTTPARPPGQSSAGSSEDSSITGSDGAKTDSNARYTGVPDFSSRIAKITRSN